MEKLVVEIEVSGYKGMTAEQVESALNYYFGSTVDITVKEAAQQSVQRTGCDHSAAEDTDQICPACQKWIG